MARRKKNDESDESDFDSPGSGARSKSAAGRAAAAAARRPARSTQALSSGGAVRKSSVYIDDSDDSDTFSPPPAVPSSSTSSSHARRKLLVKQESKTVAELDEEEQLKRVLELSKAETGSAAVPADTETVTAKASVRVVDEEVVSGAEDDDKEGAESDYQASDAALEELDGSEASSENEEDFVPSPAASKVSKSKKSAAKSKGKENVNAAAVKKAPVIVKKAVAFGVRKSLPIASTTKPSVSVPATAAAAVSSTKRRHSSAPISSLVGIGGPKRRVVGLSKSRRISQPLHPHLHAPK